MDEKYVTQEFGDFLAGLPDPVIRWFLALCMAANDIALSSKMIREYGEDSPEASFFHRMALSFLRESANSIRSYDDVSSVQNLLCRLDAQTQELYKHLVSELCLFDETSLTKSSLKPIRDVSFHYPDSAGRNFPECVAIFKALDKKEVRFSSDEKQGVLGYRYLFADNVAGYKVFSVLDSQKIDRISTVAICLCGFVDHVMDFLHTQHKKDN